MIETRESLLDRLKIEDAQDAWKEFYHLYWGAIIRYARKLGLSQHQAEEVLQETMVALMRILPAFVYDRNRGKFRNFLLTIVHRKSLGVMRRTKRESQVPWEEAASMDGAGMVAADAELALESLVRWREVVLEEALARLREDAALEENTFAVFEAYVLNRQSAPAVAAEFGLKENAVYQIKNRLLRRLQCDVARLLREGGSESGA